MEKLLSQVGACASVYVRERVCVRACVRVTVFVCLRELYSIVSVCVCVRMCVGVCITAYCSVLGVMLRMLTC